MIHVYGYTPASIEFERCNLIVVQSRLKTMTKNKANKLLKAKRGFVTMDAADLSVLGELNEQKLHSLLHTNVGVLVSDLQL